MCEMSKRSRHLWDRVQDSPLGSRAIRYLFEGIDRNPTPLQRAAVESGSFVLRNAAYLADSAIMYASSFRGSKRNLYGDMVGGGGGGAGGGTSAYRPGRLLGPVRRVLPLTKGMWVGKRTSHRMVPSSGPLSLVRKQLSLGLTNWCDQSITTSARFTGTINTQMVQTLTRSVTNFMRAASFTATNMWESFQGITERVAAGGSYYNVGGSCVLDTFTPVLSGSAAAATAFPLPRQTWELGTAFQLRDYLCNAYSLLITPTAVAGGSLVTGYIPPHVGPGPSFTAYPMGFPDFSAGSASSAQLPYARIGTDTGTQLAYLKVFERNHPLYLASEKIEFQLRNPTEQVQYVTIFELVPREDVPMAYTQMGGDWCNMGSWPDPKYLWDEWLRVYESDSMAGLADAPLDAPDQDTIQTADIPAAAVAVGTGSVYMPAKPIRTRNTPGMNPGHLVHKFYRVKARTIKLDAGCSGAVTFVLHHNRVLKAADVFTTFARANRSALYMMKVRGERLITKVTAGSTQTTDGYCQPDVLVEWRKSAKFCKFQMRPQHHRIMVSRAVRTDVTNQYDVDPESGDAEPTNTIA